MPSAYTKKDSSPSSSSQSKVKGQAFVATTCSSQQWILELGASYHMGSTKEQFSSLEPFKVPHIYIGDDTQVEVEGKGSVDMDDGTFENVLYVPNLSTNLLSIYQITLYGNGKKVEFTPDSVVVKELDDDALVAVGQVNDNSRLYSFSHFVPSSPSRALLTHSNSESKLWHERFGHLNYRCLQQLSTKDMVTGLP